MQVEFPESKIHEEMLFLLSISDRELSDAEILDTAMCRGTGGAAAAGISLAPSSSSQQPASSISLETGEETSSHDAQDTAALLLLRGLNDESTSQSISLPLQSSLQPSVGNAALPTVATRSAPMFPRAPPPQSQGQGSGGGGGGSSSNSANANNSSASTGGLHSRGPFSGSYRLGRR